MHRFHETVTRATGSTGTGRIMRPELKKRFLRTAMMVLLIGIWLFFLAQPEELVWWFWLAPIPLLLAIHEVVLRGYRCRHCGGDFGLKEVGRTPGGPLGGGRVRVVCEFCGEAESRRIGIGH